MIKMEYEAVLKKNKKILWKEKGSAELGKILETIDAEIRKETEK